MARKALRRLSETRNLDKGLRLLPAEFEKITGLAIDEWQEGTDADSNLRLLAGGVCFAATFKAAATTEQIGAWLHKIGGTVHKLAVPSRRGAPLSKRPFPISKCQNVPLLVVPYMSGAGRKLCRDAGTS